MTAYIFELFPDLIGILGVGIYVLAYAALQTGFLSGSGYAFPGLNGFAAFCILLSLIGNFHLPTALIQTCWIVISTVGIIRLYRLSHNLRFTEEEDLFRISKFPDLAKHYLRQLLDHGFWVDGDAETELTREGEKVEYLVYLANGEASVQVGDELVGTCNDDSYIGEMTCLSGEPATGTVTLTQPSRYFLISSEVLRDLCAKSTDIRIAVESSFAGDVRKKLIRSNLKAAATSR